MTAAFLGAMFGALVAAGIAYTYMRHVFMPKAAAAIAAAGFETTFQGRRADGTVAMPPMPIDVDPCTVSADLLVIRRRCSCVQCKAHVGYEDMVRDAS
jgi:hypothetical protein